MKDLIGRNIDYVRFSITDRCNLRCTYCMPEDGLEAVDNAAHTALLRYEELLYLAEQFVALGITRFKITGGEPLVRRGAVDFIRQLKTLPGVEAVTLTTNGLLLAEHAEGLLDAGIDGINVSLDSLDRARFERITRRDALPQVLAGIQAVLDNGYQKLKINMLPMAGVNEADIVPMAALAQRQPIQVRYIEMMPIGAGAHSTGIDPALVRQWLEDAYGPATAYTPRLGFGPAEYVQFDGFIGHIGFISAVHDRFCDQCNRVRLTSTGYLKLCLQYDEGIDLRPYVRSNDSAGLQVAMQTAITHKPTGHCFGQDAALPHRETKGMSDIGG